MVSQPDIKFVILVIWGLPLYYFSYLGSSVVYIYICIHSFIYLYRGLYFL